MPLKILFLSHKFYPFLGGIEVISEVLANAFTEAGHEVRLVTWSPDATQKEFPFSVIRNPSTRSLFEQHAWADLVFENNPCLQLAWPGVFFGRPSVIALHTWVASLEGKIGIQERLKLGWWLKRARKVIAVSNAIRTRCWPVATVIGNPYRVEEFRVMPNIAKTGDFVFLGRLVSDKGVALAIQAIHKLKSQESMPDSPPALDASLTIIGEGPERAKLEDLVAELNLEDRISFTGALSGEDLVTCLNRHRFMLIPSVWEEPFGVVALEGMACGCLPIVSDSGGLPDAVGQAGLTFNRGSVDDLVARIMNLLTDPALEQQLHHAAPKHLRAHHPDKVARQYLDVIETAATN